MLMLGQVGSDGVLSLAPDSARYANIGQHLAGYGPADEGAVVIFGPGYGVFLGLVFFMVGIKPVVVLLLQILLSSSSCLMIYHLAHELTGMKSVGYIAAYLSALSFTSVSLAAMVLSDTLFFFLFLAGNLAFVVGLRHGRLRLFILSGLLLGTATLVRSIGQFWPIVLIVIFLVWPREKSAHDGNGDRWRFRWRASTTVLIALIIMSGWIIRNYALYGLPTIAFTTAGGPANVAKLTIARIESRDPVDVVSQWLDEYKRENGIDVLTQVDAYKMNSEISRRTFARYPSASLETYGGLVWENLHAVNELYRAQLPQYSPKIIQCMSMYQKQSLNYLWFWLSVAGFAVLLLFRQWAGAVFAGTAYLYFSLMIGFTQWQGSRLFYPAEIAWPVLISFLVVAIVRSIGWAVRKVRMQYP